METNILAPVVVFCYNRVDHLEKTLAALTLNVLAEDSDLIIFSDGPKNETDLIGVQEVRAFLENFKNASIFKSIEVVAAIENLGLANSIINGVSRVINSYGKIIVVEDDVITSKYFLMYMNDALNKYINHHAIGSIASIVPNIKIPLDYNSTIFVSMRPSSWSWGTWSDRWNSTDWEVKDYFIQRFNFFLRMKINSWGNDLSGRLDRYVAGYNNSWAIRFDVSRIKQNQYAIHPIKSMVMSIGLDDTGTNCSLEDFNLFDIKELSSEKISIPDVPPQVDKRIQQEFKLKYKRPLISAVGEYLIVAVFGCNKNSFLVKESRKFTSLIKKI
jgi:hypothetical protein